MTFHDSNRVIDTFAVVNFVVKNTFISFNFVFLYESEQNHINVCVH